MQRMDAVVHDEEEDAVVEEEEGEAAADEGITDLSGVIVDVVTFTILAVDAEVVAEVVFTMDHGINPKMVML